MRKMAGGTVLIMCLIFGGCVTPPEIKQASATQLQLINELDSAVNELHASLDRYHRDNEALILSDMRVQLARQLIDIAVSDPNELVSPDILFEKSNTEVRAWLESVEPDGRPSTLDSRIELLERAIERSESQIAETEDPSAKVRLQILLDAKRNELDDLRLEQARSSSPPEAFVTLRDVLQSDLQAERKHREDLKRTIAVLQAQVALMQAMAATVDSWLAIDVSVDQAQADALKTALSGAFSGGEQQ